MYQVVRPVKRGTFCVIHVPVGMCIVRYVGRLLDSILLHLVPQPAIEVVAARNPDGWLCVVGVLPRIGASVHQHRKVVAHRPNLSMPLRDPYNRGTHK